MVDFCKCGWFHGFRKADLRISIKDYPRAFLLLQSGRGLAAVHDLPEFVGAR